MGRFRQFLAARRVEIWIAVIAVVAFGPLVGSVTAQPASRYALTASVADRQTVDLGPVGHSPYRLGVDRAVYEQRLRSDKAPGQPFLAVPFYVIGRAFGAQPATHLRVRGDLGVWWQTLWTATIPFAILLALTYAACARRSNRSVALAVTVSFGLGTMMLPHAVNLYGHILAGLFGFGAWLLLDRDVISARRAVAAGALAAFAVCVEYEAGIIAFALLGYVMWRHRQRIGWFLLGAAGPAMFLAAYQLIAFGKPWHTPSTYYAGVINGTNRGGYTPPGPEQIRAVLFGVRGLWVGAPLALIAVPVAVWLVRRGQGGIRDHAVMALAVFVPYLLLTAGWSGLPILEEPGPRYIIPALPFLAVPLAMLWNRVGRLVIVVSVWGAVIAVPAATTSILLGINEPPWPALPRRVLDGHFLPTIWSMGFGELGILLYAATVAACIWCFVRAWHDAPESNAHVVIKRPTSELVAR